MMMCCVCKYVNIFIQRNFCGVFWDVGVLQEKQYVYKFDMILHKNGFVYVLVVSEL